MPGFAIFTVQVIIAGVIAYLSSYITWWLPLPVFPITLRVFLTGKGNIDPIYHREYNYQRDWLFDQIIIVQTLAWTIISAMICYRGFHAWWGALIGVFIGINGCGLTVPRRWARESRSSDPD